MLREWELVRGCLLLTLAVCALVSDFISGKIRNRLILIGMAAGLIYQLWALQALGVLMFFGGAGVPVVILSVLYYFRMLGAGDIKLLAALGGILGIPGIFFCMFYALLFGGVISVLFILRRGNLKMRFLYFYQYVSQYVQTRVWKPYRSESDRSGEFHFTLPVLCSILLAIGGVY